MLHVLSKEYQVELSYGPFKIVYEAFAGEVHLLPELGKQWTFSSGFQSERCSSNSC